MLLLSISHRYQNGMSFRVSATPHAVAIITRLILFLVAASIICFIDDDKKSSDVRSFAHGESETREILRVLKTASQPCKASARVNLFSGVPSYTSTESGLIFKAPL